MTPQIIRTAADLKELDPDTMVIDCEGDADTIREWFYMNGEFDPFNERFLPAVVIATGEQVRAARKALEGA